MRYKFQKGNTIGNRFKVGQKAAYGYGQTPFGYDFDPAKKKKVINHFEMSVVSEMVRMKEAGITFEAIASILTNRGIEKKRGGTNWHHGVIWPIIFRHQYETFFKQSLEAYRVETGATKEQEKPFVFEADAVGITAAA